MDSAGRIRVAVCGAAGRMGREVVRAVAVSGDMELAAAIDRSEHGLDAGELVGGNALCVGIRDDLREALAESGAEVMVDFTVPGSALGNIEMALRGGVAAVVGTTGLSPDDLERVRGWSEETRIPALVAPNFAIGAVLMM